LFAYRECRGDPYVRNDLFESIVIRRWHWGLGNPDARL
jgi:hypothetical protein